MIFLHFCQLGSFLNGVVQRAEFVDKADAEGIGSQPHTALSNAVDIVARHLAAVGHDVEEVHIAAIGIALQVAHLIAVLVTEDETRLIVAVAVGGDAVPSDAKFVADQSAEIGNKSEDADTARDGGRFGEYIVGAAADHIAARGSHTAHRDDNGFLRLQLLDGVPNLLRSNGAAAARVNTEHDGLYLLVVGKAAQVVGRGAAHDVMSAHKATHQIVYDFTVGIVDGNLVALFLHFLRRLQVQHVVECEQVEVVVLADAQLTAHHLLHLLRIESTVDEVGFLVVGSSGEEHDAVVGHLVELIGSGLAALCNLLCPLAPDAVQIGFTLLTILGTHVLAGDALHITFILAHAGTLVLHAQLLIQACHIHRLAAKALEVDHARDVKEHRVGHRTDVVAGLQHLITVCIHPLAALAEIGQSVANLLCCSGRIKLSSATLEVDALNVLLVTCQTDGLQNVIEAHIVDIGGAKQKAQRISVLRALTHHSVQFEHEDGVLLRLNL